MKKTYLIVLTLLFCLLAHAQKFTHIEDKAFNWGGTVGFNSTFPVINSLKVNDAEVENVRMEYKVGYLASAFCRVNMDRFFIQPSLSWRYSEGDIRFNIQPSDNLSDHANPLLSENQLQYKTVSLEVPVMIGYYLVKEGPYALSWMVGPNIKYNYKTRYTAHFYDTPREYTNDSTPFGINIATGLSVSIWRLFFDFTYEFGLNHVESNFKERHTPEPIDGNITINKRTNVMSFSLGFLF